MNGIYQPESHRGLLSPQPAYEERSEYANANAKLAAPATPFPRTDAICGILEEVHKRLAHLEQILDPVMFNGGDVVEKEPGGTAQAPNCLADSNLMKIEGSSMELLRKVIRIERRLVLGKA